MPAPWNKGLTKHTSDVIAGCAKTLSRLYKGVRPKMTLEQRKAAAELARKRMLVNNPSKRPEVRAKIRTTLLATYAAHPEILENRKPAGINQYSTGFTSIEKKIADVLTCSGIAFAHNYKIGRYFADFLILDNVVIECDGEYWHRDADKESRRTKYLHDRGFYVFHLDEDRINKDPSGCVDTVIGVMRGLGSDQVLGFSSNQISVSHRAQP